MWKVGSERVTDRMVCGTVHVSEADVAIHYGDKEDGLWLLWYGLDAGLAISIKPRVQPADFSQDDF
jgi:hypothetical protein